MVLIHQQLPKNFLKFVEVPISKPVLVNTNHLENCTSGFKEQFSSKEFLVNEAH